MSAVIEAKILSKLDKEDIEKVEYFVDLLIKQKKYENLRKEINQRRKEIENGEMLSHDEIWNELECTR